MSSLIVMIIAITKRIIGVGFNSAIRRGVSLVLILAFPQYLG